MAESNGVYIPVNMDVSQAERELEKLKKKMASAEMEKMKISVEMATNDETLKELEKRRAELEEIMSTFKLEKQNGQWTPTSDEYSPEEIAAIQQEWGAVNQALAEAQEKSESLKTKWEEVSGSLATDEQIAEAMSEQVAELNSQTEETVEAVEEGEEATSGWSQMFDQIGEASEKFTKRLTKMIKNALFFRVFSRGLMKIKQWLSKAAMTSDEFADSLKELKGSFITLVTPILNWAIPKLATLLQVLNAMVKHIGSLFMGLFGSSWDNASQSAENLSDNMASAANSAGKVKKSLAGIDEINQLDGNSGGGGGGSSASPTFDTQSITDKVLQIEAIVAGATLAIGAILCFSGANIPLGIGLMVLGATTLAAEVKVNWDTMSPKVRKTIATVVGILSGALLAVGGILTMSGANLPLGIGLMIAGAAGLAAQATISWSVVSDQTKRALGKLETTVGSFMLVLGVILLMAGATIGIGIALIIGGLAATVTGVAINWNSTPNKVRAAVTTIMSYIAGAMLVIGLLLLLTGAGVGVGIALILGAVTIGALSIDWDYLMKKLKTAWENIKKWWKNNVAPKFTKEFWQEKFKTIAEGLKAKIKDGVNGAIALMNRFIDWVNKKMKLSWGDFKILGQTIIPSGSFTLLTLPHIPYLAQGAVVPPNNPFLAMLGDNKQETEVVSPLSTMKEALIEALNESGIGNQNIALFVDGRELFDIVVNRNNSEVMRTGKTRLAT